MAATGPAEQGRDRENVPAVESTFRPPLPTVRSAATRPTIEPSAKSGASGRARHRTPASRSPRGDARSVRDRCRRDRDPTERLVPPSPGSNMRAANDPSAGERQADDEVPGRSRRTEVLRTVHPQPVLELVDGGEEERGGERRRNPDEGAETDEARARSPDMRRGRLGRAHTSPRAAQAGRGQHERRLRDTRQRSRSSACRSASSPAA